MKFIALKTCDGGAKGRISFCCKALKVTRQVFHEYLKNRNKLWKHEELAAKMMEILHEDECNDTYGLERMIFFRFCDFLLIDKETRGREIRRKKPK